MGSFYSTCSISHMTLMGGMKVVRYLLVPTKAHLDGYDSRHLLKEKGLMVSNDGAMAMFVPFGFAIRGEYYDYGRLENIQRDVNVEMLEEFFGLPIESILEAASDDRWYDYGIKRPQEALAKKARGETLDSSEQYDIDSAESWKLEGGEPKHMDVLRDLTFTDIQADVHDAICQRKLDEPHGKWGLMTRFENAVRKFFETQAKCEAKKDDFLARMLFNENAKVYLPQFVSHNMFTDLPLTEAHTEMMREQFLFLSGVSAMYRFLMPSNYGGQEYNYDLVIQVNRAANKAMREQKKELASW